MSVDGQGCLKELIQFVLRKIKYLVKIENIQAVQIPVVDIKIYPETYHSKKSIWAQPCHISKKLSSRDFIARKAMTLSPVHGEPVI